MLTRVSPCDKGQLCFDVGNIDVGKLSEKTTSEISNVVLVLEFKKTTLWYSPLGFENPR